MKTWIAFFRGINVGGNTKLPMKSLIALLESLGLSAVRTYIQSGNVVFCARQGTALQWAQKIQDAVATKHGFSPWIKIIDVPQLTRIAAENPFPEAEADHKSLHLFFLAHDPPSPDFATLERLKAPSEAYVLKGAVFYLHAPDGIGRSKLAAQVERKLRVETTARNWRTVCETLALARQT